MSISLNSTETKCLHLINVSRKRIEKSEALNKLNQLWTEPRSTIIPPPGSGCHHLSEFAHEKSSFSKIEIGTGLISNCDGVLVSGNNSTW